MNLLKGTSITSLISGAISPKDEMSVEGVDEGATKGFASKPAPRPRRTKTEPLGPPESVGKTAELRRNNTGPPAQTPRSSTRTPRRVPSKSGPRGMPSSTPRRTGAAASSATPRATPRRMNSRPSRGSTGAAPSPSKTPRHTVDKLNSRPTSTPRVSATPRRINSRPKSGPLPSVTPRARRTPSSTGGPVATPRKVNSGTRYSAAPSATPRRKSLSSPVVPPIAGRTRPTSVNDGNTTRSMYTGRHSSGGASQRTSRDLASTRSEGYVPSLELRNRRKSLAEGELPSARGFKAPIQPRKVKSMHSQQVKPTPRGSIPRPTPRATPRSRSGSMTTPRRASSSATPRTKPPQTKPIDIKRRMSRSNTDPAMSNFTLPLDLDTNDQTTKPSSLTEAHSQPGAQAGADSSMAGAVLDMPGPAVSESNVMVLVRLRPASQMESSKGETPSTMISTTDHELEIDGELAMTPSGNPLRFKFDHVFDDTSTQEQVFARTAPSTIVNLFKGFHTTIFAYGQTGSGKSYTMMGKSHAVNSSASDDAAHTLGLIPRCTKAIFDVITKFDHDSEVTIGCSYLQVYQERISDLLDPTRENLPIRESTAEGVYVEGLSKEYVGCEEDVYELIQIGEANRFVSGHKMNEESSRSHSCFTLNISQKDKKGRTKLSRLNLVDLAGSERLSKTEAAGQTADEARKINLSLLTLSQCINALSKAGSGRPGHVPFRVSKLTYLLKDSLGGNCKTTVVCTASPHVYNLRETISTLQFGSRCSNIKCQVKPNIKLNPDDLQAMVSQLQAELARARRGSAKPSKGVRTRDMGVQCGGDGSHPQSMPLRSHTSGTTHVLTTIHLPDHSPGDFGDQRAGSEVLSQSDAGKAVCAAFENHVRRQVADGADEVQQVGKVEASILSTSEAAEKEGGGVIVTMQTQVDDQKAVDTVCALSMGMGYGDHGGLMRSLDVNGVRVSPKNPPRWVKDPEAVFSDTGPGGSSSTSTGGKNASAEDGDETEGSGSGLSLVDELYRKLMEQQVKLDTTSVVLENCQARLVKAEELAELRSVQLAASQLRETDKEESNSGSSNKDGKKGDQGSLDDRVDAERRVRNKLSKHLASGVVATLHPVDSNVEAGNGTATALPVLQSETQVVVRDVKANGMIEVELEGQLSEVVPEALTTLVGVSSDDAHQNHMFEDMVELELEVEDMKGTIQRQNRSLDMVLSDKLELESDQREAQIRIDGLQQKLSQVESELALLRKREMRAAKIAQSKLVAPVAEKGRRKSGVFNIFSIFTGKDEETEGQEDDDQPGFFGWFGMEGGKKDAKGGADGDRDDVKALSDDILKALNFFGDSSLDDQDPKTDGAGGQSNYGLTSARKAWAGPQELLEAAIPTSRSTGAPSPGVDDDNDDDDVDDDKPKPATSLKLTSKSLSMIERQYSTNNKSPLPLVSPKDVKPLNMAEITKSSKRPASVRFGEVTSVRSSDAGNDTDREVTTRSSLTGAGTRRSMPDLPSIRESVGSGDADSVSVSDDDETVARPLSSRSYQGSANREDSMSSSSSSDEDTTPILPKLASIRKGTSVDKQGTSVDRKQSPNEKGSSSRSGTPKFFEALSAHSSRSGNSGYQETGSGPQTPTATPKGNKEKLAGAITGVLSSISFGLFDSKDGDTDQPQRTSEPTTPDLSAPIVTDDVIDFNTHTLNVKPQSKVGDSSPGPSSPLPKLPLAASPTTNTATGDTHRSTASTMTNSSVKTKTWPSNVKVKDKIRAFELTLDSPAPDSILSRVDGDDSARGDGDNSARDSARSARSGIDQFTLPSPRKGRKGSIMGSTSAYERSDELELARRTSNSKNTATGIKSAVTGSAGHSSLGSGEAGDRKSRNMDDLLFNADFVARMESPRTGSGAGGAKSKARGIDLEDMSPRASPRASPRQSPRASPRLVFPVYASLTARMGDDD